MKRKIIVFGASGEIGGRIARGCVDSGHQVIGVSRGKNQRAVVDLAGVEMIYGDKHDESFIRDTVAKLDFDAVVDSIPNLDSIALYHRYLQKAQNILICSSTGTFVPLRYFPADESHPWREETSVNFWDQSVRDANALDLWARDQFPITILRPTNIIGPDRVPLELWGGRNIEFFKKLKAGEPIAIPPCHNVLLQSGSNSDLADAFVKALDCPEAVRGEIFIISCKRAVTLGHYLQTAMEYLGSTSEVQTVSSEKLMEIHPEISWRFGLEFLLEHMSFDISKAERIFGYQPQKTTDDGLCDALQWCRASGLL